MAGLVVTTVPGGSAAKSPVTVQASAPDGQRGVEDLRRDASGSASRNTERAPETADSGGAQTDAAEGGDDGPGNGAQGNAGQGDEPASAEATVVPKSDSARGSSGSTHRQAEDKAADEPVSAKQPESSLPGGFAAVQGCDATIPGDGEVANGYLGSEHLCDVGDGHELRPDAGAAFQALADVYAGATGKSLAGCIGNAYRSYDLQARLYQEKPGLAAQPGTSQHGWGLAIDFECGANSYTSSFHGWLEANGREYGWINPPWAQADGSRPEPWHWEFDPALLSSSGSTP